MKRRKKRIVSPKRREKIDAAIAGMKQDLEKESARLKSAADMDDLLSKLDDLEFPDLSDLEMELEQLDLQFPPDLEKELEMKLPDIPDILDVPDLDMSDIDIPGLDLP